MKNDNTPGPVIVLINHQDGPPLTHEDTCVWVWGGERITDVMRAADAGVFGTPMISFTWGTGQLRAWTCTFKEEEGNQ